MGEETAELLSRNFQFSIFNFQNISLEELQQIPGIGAIAAKSVHDWFQSKSNREFIKRLLELGVEIQAPPKIGKKLVGKIFVLTGSLESITRSEAKKKIRMLGGDPAESVSEKTDYLVAGENPGSKLKKAQDLKVNIISEKQFLNLIS